LKTSEKADPQIKKRAKEIIEILSAKYPDPQCALTHLDPWQLMVATILSAQCTDKRVNMVTPGLFKEFNGIKAFADADQEALEKAIHSTGFYHNKARNIIACARALLERHAGVIPQTLAALTELPGVGRKTASVVLGTGFGKAEGIVVDTHVTRLAQRMGLSLHTDAEKIEQDLMKVVAKKHWINFSHFLIMHGRERCAARRADCGNCELQIICPKRI